MRRAWFLFPLFLMFPLSASTALAQLGSPLAVSDKGEVFFDGNGSVWKIAADGTLSAAVTGKRPSLLVLNPDGTLCGDHQAWDATSKQQMYSFWLASPDGAVRDLVIPTATPPRGFSCLQDAAGNMLTWVGNGDHRQIDSYLLKRTPAGEVSVVAGGRWGQRDGPGSEAQFGNVGGMALSRDGVVYVADDDSIRKIATDGTVTTLARGGLLTAFPQADKMGSLNPMPGIAVGEDGNVYAAHFSNGTVLKITPAGQVSKLMQLDWRWGPIAVAASADGIYVLQTPNTPLTDGPRVQWLAQNGQVITLATLPQPRSVLGLVVLSVLGIITLGVVVLLLVAHPRREAREARESGRAA